MFSARDSIGKRIRDVRQRKAQAATQRAERRERLTTMLERLALDFRSVDPRQIGYFLANEESLGWITPAEKSILYIWLVQLRGQAFADQAFGLRRPSEAGKKAGRKANLVERSASGPGLSVGDVKVQADEEARRRTEVRSASGLMEDGHVYLHHNRSDPETREGRHLFAHEPVHLAQRSMSGTGAAESQARAQRETAAIGDTFARGEAIQPPVHQLNLMATSASPTATQLPRAVPSEKEQRRHRRRSRRKRGPLIDVEPLKSSVAHQPASQSTVSASNKASTPLSAHLLGLQNALNCLGHIVVLDKTLWRLSYKSIIRYGVRIKNFLSGGTRRGTSGHPARQHAPEQEEKRPIRGVPSQYQDAYRALIALHEFRKDFRKGVVNLDGVAQFVTLLEYMNSVLKRSYTKRRRKGRRFVMQKRYRILRWLRSQRSAGSQVGHRRRSRRKRRMRVPRWLWKWFHWLNWRGRLGKIRHWLTQAKALRPRGNLDPEAQFRLYYDRLGRMSPEQARREAIAYQHALVLMPQGYGLYFLRRNHKRVLRALRRKLKGYVNFGVARRRGSPSTYNRLTTKQLSARHQTGKKHDFGALDIWGPVNAKIDLRFRSSVSLAEFPKALQALGVQTNVKLDFRRGRVRWVHRTSDLHDRAGKIVKAFHLKTTRYRRGLRIMKATRLNSTSLLWAAMALHDASAEDNSVSHSNDPRLAKEIREFRRVVERYEALLKLNRRDRKEVNCDPRHGYGVVGGDFRNPRRWKSKFGKLANSDRRLYRKMRADFFREVTHHLNRIWLLTRTSKIRFGNRGGIKLMYTDHPTRPKYRLDISILVEHMRKLAPGFYRNRRFKTPGLAVGTVGATGNTASPHLHIGADFKLRIKRQGPTTPPSPRRRRRRRRRKASSWKTLVALPCSPFAFLAIVRKRTP